MLDKKFFFESSKLGSYLLLVRCPVHSENQEFKGRDKLSLYGVNKTYDLRSVTQNLDKLAMRAITEEEHESKYVSRLNSGKKYNTTGQMNNSVEQPTKFEVDFGQDQLANQNQNMAKEKQNQLGKMFKNKKILSNGEKSEGSQLNLSQSKMELELQKIDHFESQQSIDKEKEIPQTNRRLAFQDITNTENENAKDERYNESRFNLKTGSKSNANKNSALLSEKTTLAGTNYKIDQKSRNVNDDKYRIGYDTNNKENEIGKTDSGKVSDKLSIGGSKQFRYKKKPTPRYWTMSICSDLVCVP